MGRTLPELLLKPVGATDHLIIGALVGELGDGEMTLGMGADGDQRIGGQCPDLVPAHHQSVAVAGHVHAVAPLLAHHGAPVALMYESRTDRFPGKHGFSLSQSNTSTATARRRGIARSQKRAQRHLRVRAVTTAWSSCCARSRKAINGPVWSSPCSTASSPSSRVGLP